MPFTVTHLLAVVPFARWRGGWLPFSALAIGAMIPDLPLFTRFSPSYELTHSPLGVVTACLPTGLLAYVVFHGVLRRPAWAMLPLGWQQRLRPDAELSWRPWSWLPVLFALVIGAATHLVWDSFTHAGRAGVVVVPGLSDPWLHAFGMTLPGYQVLQFGGSALGLPLIGWLLWRWYRRQTPMPGQILGSLPASGKWIVWSVLLLLPTAVALLAWFGPGSIEQRGFRAAVRSGACLGALFLAYAVVYQLIIHRRSPMGDEHR